MLFCSLGVAGLICQLQASLYTNVSYVIGEYKSHDVTCFRSCGKVV